MSGPVDRLLPHTPWTRLRTVLNWLNLSTVLGLTIAKVGGATIARRGRGTYLAGGYRWCSCGTRTATARSTPSASVS